MLVWGGEHLLSASRAKLGSCRRPKQLWVHSGKTKTRIMTNHSANPVPNGVRAIAALFALCGIYLGIVGGLMLVRPGTISMSAGPPLLFGLELPAPYMFFLPPPLPGASARGLRGATNTFSPQP